jgi:hypothetical protein
MQKTAVLIIVVLFAAGVLVFSFIGLRELIPLVSKTEAILSMMAGAFLFAALSALYAITSPRK